MLSCSLRNYTVEGHIRGFSKLAFLRYLSREVVERRVITLGQKRYKSHFSGTLIVSETRIEVIYMLIFMPLIICFKLVGCLS